MLLAVNNEQYRKAKKNGFAGSYAEFAEYCNNWNSEQFDKSQLISPRMYFNDIGSTSAAAPGSIPAASLDGATQKELDVLDIVKEKVAQGAGTAGTSPAPAAGTIMGLNPFVFVLIIVLFIMGGLVMLKPKADN